MLTKGSVNGRHQHSGSNLPAYTEIHTTSPIAAGLPVLEIVRKLEEEKILLRDDRAVLKEALYSSDPARREEVIKALCEVELHQQSRFAVRKLKAVIHQNNAGEVSSKRGGPVIAADPARANLMHQYEPSTKRPIVVATMTAAATAANASTAFTPSRAGPEVISPEERNPSPPAKKDPSPRQRDTSPNGSPQSGGGGHSGKHSKTPSPPPRRSPDKPLAEDEEEDVMNIQETITKVVGECPLYSGNNHFGVLSKIEKRLHDVSSKLSSEKMAKMRFAVIIGAGSYNPLTRIHLRSYYLAKQYLESKLGVLVLGSLLSPAHAVTVRERYRTHPLEILPAPHRLAIAQLLVESSQFLSIDPWEMTRRRAMDYLSLIEHTLSIMRARFADIAPSCKIYYLCKSNSVVKLSPQALRALNANVISVCRTPEADILKSQLNSKWNGIIHVVEDSAILDASLDQVTSRKVRDKIKMGDSVEQLVGSKINDYVMAHRVQQKVTENERE